MIQLEDNAHLHVFETRGMNTVFRLRVELEDSARASEAASACFVLLEDLEAKLSRYRPDSEISQINHLQTGESLLISPEVHACLVQALEATQRTGGLFDITLGSRSGEGGEAALTGQLRIEPDQPKITCLEAGRQLDLGGIGKGYALDRLKDRLGDFGIVSALLTAGSSTLLAMGPGEWPIVLKGDGESSPWSLQDVALSASGSGIQGVHIFHPHAGEEITRPWKRVWIQTEQAARADAFSTAGFLMTADELERFVSAGEGLIRAMTEPVDGSPIREVAG